MGTLRIRVELNKGGRGYSLEKLSRIAEDTRKFLSSACKDAGLTDGAKDWLAVNFENNSVDFDCEMVTLIEPEIETRAREIIRTVMSNSFNDSNIENHISPQTK